MAATGDLLDLFRVEVVDRVEPYLWSDDFILGAIDDAQSQFARKTEGILDSATPAVTELSVVPSAEFYNLHPTVLRIRSAYRTDTGRPIEVLNFEDMIARQWYFDGRTGPIRTLVIGMSEGSVRAWPIPNETVTVKLSTFRLPLTPITDDQALEIPAQHYRGLLLWVKHLAYSVQDAETSDRIKAEKFEEAFELYCAKAKKEQERLRHKPRSVSYGGI